MKTKSENPIPPSVLTLLRGVPVLQPALAGASVRLPASVAPKAYLRLVRQMEMETWERTGGDFLLRGARSVTGRR